VDLRGSDAKRGAAKYRCPSGECSPASTWVKADRLHTLVARETDRCRKLYRRGGSVERGFRRLKNESALLALPVRRIERVRLHADLAVLTRLAVAVAKARAAPLAA
jgi:transposase